MDIKKSELEAFFEKLEGLEANKKAIAEEMKESVESFARNNELSKKSVNKAFKEFKDAKKDKDDYILTDFESDKLLLIMFPEFDTKEDYNAG